MAIVLQAQPLTRAAFASFGDVIETDGAEHFPINAGSTERYHDLASVDLGPEPGARTLVNIFHGQPVAGQPLPLRLMERHPLGSQAFVPLSARPFLVVVAAPDSAPTEPDNLHVFLTAPGQGVNYARGVWHHPLLALEAVSDFLVVDRGGPGHNCDEVEFDPAQPVQISW
jgi:ureidoglycolate lyase